MNFVFDILYVAKSEFVRQFSHSFVFFKTHSMNSFSLKVSKPNSRLLNATLLQKMFANTYKLVIGAMIK